MVILNKKNKLEKLFLSSEEKLENYNNELQKKINYKNIYIYKKNL